MTHHVRVSGLSDDHAAHARHLIVKSAELMIRHKNEIHYSQGPDRWEGINHHLTVTKGQFPSHCDCSATAEWMLWDAIHRTYGVRDLLSHTNWTSGWTGSLYTNGIRVVHDENLKIGDLIFYGTQAGGVPEHVAVYIGGGHVFSHGSEGGPYILTLDYRPDRRMSRRYI